MKKIVEVTITKRYEIEIQDQILGDNAVNLFSENIFEIDSIDEIFEHAAFNAENGHDGYYIDYIGLLGEKGMTYPDGEGGYAAAETTYRLLDEYAEYEVE